MDTQPGLQQRGPRGSTRGSLAPGGSQPHRARKQPPRLADFKLQAVITGSRWVGKTSLMADYTSLTTPSARPSSLLWNAGLGELPKPDMGQIGSLIIALHARCLTNRSFPLAPTRFGYVTHCKK
ncbi:hypothetical protein NDU88_011211 [Pleurodeles waltl]|uniref:Uncharacterized protein n=1 Tax=Pleurodeles waltl TaxID=8319 RepID=A0AAV7QZQ9_PLEWA|nr:hypothetical protein NDU88_011211 [Pleurodeles waltl]